MGSLIRIRIRIRNPEPDSRGQKIPTKIEKKSRTFMFLSIGCSLLRAEGFSCSLDIRKLQFFIKKIYIKNFLLYFLSKLQLFVKKRYKKLSAVFFSSVYSHQNPGFEFIESTRKPAIIPSKLQMTNEQKIKNFTRKREVVRSMPCRA
jgi:hypothetical protein